MLTNLTEKTNSIILTNDKLLNEQQSVTRTMSVINESINNSSKLVVESFMEKMKLQTQKVDFIYKIVSDIDNNRDTRLHNEIKGIVCK